MTAGIMLRAEGSLGVACSFRWKLLYNSIGKVHPRTGPEDPEGE
jgi:hypothetical protein